MKRYLIPVIAVLMVLAVAWAAFGQTEERARQRESTRQRFRDMSEEEREQFRAQMRERGGRGGFMSPEEQEKAIKVIEAELAKLRAAQITPPEGGFQNLSEDERTQLREKMAKVRQERRQALQNIIAQVASLQGRGQPAAQGEQYIIVNVGDLKPIQAAAKKEKAEETAQLLENLIARGSGRGFGGGPEARQRPQREAPEERQPADRGGAGRQRNR